MPLQEINETYANCHINLFGWEHCIILLKRIALILLFPVELEHGPVLPVPHHGRLHDLPERGLLRRRHEQRAQLVDPHPVRVQVQLAGALKRRGGRCTKVSRFTNTGRAIGGPNLLTFYIL